MNPQFKHRQCPSVTNLAPGKPVTQSSTAYGGVPERANDNNTDGDWNDNSVTHTVNEPSPWWQIDLQANYNIDHIEVWNRTNSCCISRMANYYVFVSDVPFASGNLNTTLNQSGVWNSLNASYPNPVCNYCCKPHRQICTYSIGQPGRIEPGGNENFRKFNEKCRWKSTRSA